MKNVVQTILSVVAALTFSLGWPIWIGYVTMIVVAVLAAFEVKKWFSATEVLFAAVTIAVSSTWYLGLAGAVLLAVWNASCWIAPLKEKLIKAG